MLTACVGDESFEQLLGHRPYRKTKFGRDLGVLTNKKAPCPLAKEEAHMNLLEVEKPG